ncbi:hypothetical protein STXM2123_394 [Streptomyces sp. F-3]|nr:hypothetical protein STXM2123_394 [Streptomyces sp. F-3]
MKGRSTGPERSSPVPSPLGDAAGTPGRSAQKAPETIASRSPLPPTAGGPGVGGAVRAHQQAGTPCAVP